LLLHLLRRQPGYDRGDAAVCTKTTASYERACKAFERDQRNLSRIVRIEEGLGWQPGDHPRNDPVSGISCP